MKRVVVTAALLAASFAVQPALATEWMYCGGDGASIGFLLGSVEGFLPSAITIDVGDKHWSTSEVYGEGAPISFGQGYEDANTLIVDVLNDQMSEQVAQLRIFKTLHNDLTISGGILTVFGEGAWTATCEYDY